MKRLIKLQAPRKRKEDYPDISSQEFIDYLMYKTNSGNLSDLSAKVPFSQSYLGSIYNSYMPLTKNFVEKVQNKLDFTLDDYSEWLSNRDREDTGRKDLKKKKRNDFDQVQFLKFVEDIVERRAGLKKQDIIDILGLSRTLWDSMMNEKTPLTDKTITAIDNKFGIGKEEFEYYLSDPKNMIDYITSKELEDLSKNYHKGQLINRPTGYSKFLEDVTGLNSSQISDEIGQNPQQAIRKEDGKVTIPKNLVDKVQKTLGLSFEDYKEYRNNSDDVSKFQNDAVKKLQLKYAPEGQKNPKSRQEMHDTNTTEFINFLLKSTGLSASKLSKVLGYDKSQLNSMKTNGTKLSNQFLHIIEEKLGLTLDDFYAYQQDSSNLKTVNVEVPEEHKKEYTRSKLVDMRRAPSYIVPEFYVKFLIEATGKKITQIPQDLGLSHSYISNVKQGKIPLYLELLKNVQAVYGLTVSDYYNYTQTGQVPNKNSDQFEEVEGNETPALMALNQQSSFLTYVCLLTGSNLMMLANDLGYNEHDIIEINTGRVAVDQNFINVINERYSIDSLNDFNSLAGHGFFNMFGIEDLRNQNNDELTNQEENKDLA